MPTIHLALAFEFHSGEPYDFLGEFILLADLVCLQSIDSTQVQEGCTLDHFDE